MWSVNLEIFLKYPFVLLTGFLATFLLTPLTIRFGRSFGFMDQPGDRHIHACPVPRCGIAVFLGVHLACAAIFLLPWKAFHGELTPLWWWRFLILSTILMAVGLVDDRIGLRPLYKLVGQVLVALLAFAFDMRVGRLLGADLPLVIDLVVTTAWFVVIINAFNLIDGIDGLATGLGGIAGIGLAGSFLIRHMPGDALILLGLVGACMAFLRYNFQPAKIFLGDSGSMFLGLTIASIAVSTGAKGTALASVAVPLLAVGVPVFDTFLAVWRRSVRRYLRTGERTEGAAESRVFEGDSDHVHHRLLQRGLSHRAAAAWLYALSVALVSVGLLSAMSRSHAVGIYIIAFVLASYVAVRHIANLELWVSGRAILQGLERSSSRMLASLLYIPADLLLLALALAVMSVFSDESLAETGFRSFWFDRIPLWVGVPFLALFFSRAYHRVWSLANPWDYVTVVVALLAGVMLAAGLNGIIQTINLRCMLQDLVVYACVATPLVVSTRILPRAVESAMGSMAARRAVAGGAEVRHTLLYGAGSGFSTYLQHVAASAMSDRNPSHIVGLFSDDRSLRDRYVQGFRVNGGIERVAGAIEKHHVETIVITDRISAETRVELLRLGAVYNLRVEEQRVVVEVLATVHGGAARAAPARTRMDAG